MQEIEFGKLLKNEFSKTFRKANATFLSDPF